MAEQLLLNFDEPSLNHEEWRVWNCVRDHRGKGNEVLGTRITEHTGIEYDRVRAIISHLRRQHGKLIGSNAHGYYIPITKDELYEVTKSLRHRGIMILVLVSKLIGNSLEDVFHQGRLELTIEEKQ